MGVGGGGGWGGGGGLIKRFSNWFVSAAHM